MSAVSSGGSSHTLGGVGMDGIEKQRVGMGLGQPPDGGADVLQGLSQVFPAVRRHHHKASAFGQALKLRQGKGIVGLHGVGQGVNHGVSRDKYVVGDVFLLQTGGIARRGRKVQPRKLPRDKTVALLGEGGVLVVGAQARLHMPHRDVAVKGGQRGGGRQLRHH